jgi:hypothetical protein
MTIGELGERVGQPSVWVDARDLVVLDQRGDDRPVIAALIGAGDNWAFLRLRAIGLIDRSTVLVSRSTRPSWRKTLSPCQLFTRNNHGSRAAISLIVGGSERRCMRGVIGRFSALSLGLSAPSADFRRTYPVAAHRSGKIRRSKL